MNDRLLASLVELTHILGRPASEGTLVAGLPLVDDSLTLELFPRAAAHVELNAKLIRFGLENKVTHFPVPLVLILKDNNACLLTDITAYHSARVIQVPNSKPQEMGLDELKLMYTGQAFLIEPNFRFSARSSHAAFEGRSKNWFWSSIRNLWGAYSEMLVGSFLINVFSIALPLFTMNVYDRVIPNRAFETLWVLASGIFIVFTFDILMRNLRSYFIDQAGKTVDLQVSATILERVMGIKMIDRPNSVGAFANTVQSFDAVREFITSTTIAVLVDLPFALLFIVIIGIIGGALIWVPLVMLPLVVIFGLLIQRPLIHLTKITHRYAAEKQGILFEILNGIETVKTDCAEHMMQNRWEQVVNLSAQAGLRLRFVVNMSMFFSIFIQQLSTVVIVILGVYKISQNQLTTGGLIACTILASRALAPMSQIAALLTRYDQTVTSLNSLNNIMTLPVEREPGQLALHVPLQKGDLEFRDVNFQYNDRAASVLQNISFHIRPGEHIGIIGRIGSGKTTIAKLILNLLQPTHGSLFFDGVDQTTLDVAELRHNIGYVPQDVTLFYGTLRDNITFGSPHVEDQKIIRAIEIAGVEELLKPFLGGYEAIITEGGKNLSGGQRRIIAIARAVLHDPPILIFDEPTHSMDSQTEDLIKKRLMGYLQNKTFVLMTHRPAMLSLVDRVVVIDAGRLIMEGPRDAVLQALAEGRVKVPKV